MKSILGWAWPTGKAGVYEFQNSNDLGLCGADWDEDLVDVVKYVYVPQVNGYFAVLKDEYGDPERGLTLSQISLLCRKLFHFCNEKDSFSEKEKIEYEKVQNVW